MEEAPLEGIFLFFYFFFFFIQETSSKSSSSDPSATLWNDPRVGQSPSPQRPLRREMLRLADQSWYHRRRRHSGSEAPFGSKVFGLRSGAAPSPTARHPASVHMCTGACVKKRAPCVSQSGLSPSESASSLSTLSFPHANSARAINLR